MPRWRSCVTPGDEIDRRSLNRALLERNRMDRAMPDYAARKRWLAEHGHQLGARGRARARRALKKCWMVA
jgi:hypothetical protein